MLIGSLNSSLNALAMMPDTFYLTGSRFFALDKMTPLTDYDYMVQVRSGIEAELIELGFNTIADYTYTDNATVCVMRRGNVDVQIVRDVRVKLLAQFYLYATDKLRKANKSQRRELWNEAIAQAVFYAETTCLFHA